MGTVTQLTGLRKRAIDAANNTHTNGWNQLVDNLQAIIDQARDDTIRELAVRDLCPDTLGPFRYSIVGPVVGIGAEVDGILFARYTNYAEGRHLGLYVEAGSGWTFVPSNRTLVTVGEALLGISEFEEPPIPNVDRWETMP